MKTSKLKKGDKIILNSGLVVTIANNSKGFIRQVWHDGELCDVFTWNIEFCYKRHDFGELGYMVNLTEIELTKKEIVAKKELLDFFDKVS